MFLVLKKINENNAHNTNKLLNTSRSRRSRFGELQNGVKAESFCRIKYEEQGRENEKNM